MNREDKEILMRKAEMDGMKHVLMELLDICHPKCIDRSYSNKGLSSTELVCIDQCSKKV